MAVVSATFEYVRVHRGQVRELWPTVRDEIDMMRGFIFHELFRQKWDNFGRWFYKFNLFIDFLTIIAMLVVAVAAKQMPAYDNMGNDFRYHLVRDVGPIVVLVCLCAATFFGLIYSDKHFNSKSLTSNDTVNCCLKAQRKRGGGEGGRRIRRASPSPPSRTITNPQPGAGGLPRRETLRGNAGGGAAAADQQQTLGVRPACGRQSIL